MKIAVFSDSHGVTAPMSGAISEYNPDMIFHLGDCAADTLELSRMYPRIPILSVCGNCDPGRSGNDTETTYINGVKILLTHGHRYSVKTGLVSLLNYAHFSGTELVLFGHTHTAMDESFYGIRLINPGSCGKGKRSFAMLDISDDGKVSCEHISI